MCGALSSHSQPIRVKWHGVIACIVSVMEIEDTVCPCTVCMKKQNRDNKKHTGAVCIVGVWENSRPFLCPEEPAQECSCHKIHSITKMVVKAAGKCMWVLS